jgi:hypothetical protein
MDSTRIVTNQDGMTDIWRATDLEFIDFWERVTGLGDLYQRWQAARTRNGTMPRAADFDVSDIPPVRPQGHGGAPDHLPDIFRADADPATPADFRITAPAAGLRSARLCTLFRPILRNALFSDLMLCQGLRKPLYQQIYQKVSGDERCYVRLLLPTVDGQGQIRRIHGASRPLYAEQELVHWSAS